MKDMCDEVNDVIQEQKQLINKGFENLEKLKNMSKDLISEKVIEISEISLI